eukprot:4884130-Pyramimonas_sp.AAC.1
MSVHQVQGFAWLTPQQWFSARNRDVRAQQSRGFAALKSQERCSGTTQGRQDATVKVIRGADVTAL